MKKVIEETRIAPRFNCSNFSLECDDPADLQHTIDEFMRDYQPITAVEVVNVQRAAFMHWKGLQGGRAQVGVLRHYSTWTNTWEKLHKPGAESAPELANPNSSQWTEILGSALIIDQREGKAWASAAHSVAPADREFHRCLARLDRMRDLRRAYRPMPAQKTTEASPEAPPQTRTAFLAAG